MISPKFWNTKGQSRRIKGKNQSVESKASKRIYSKWENQKILDSQRKNHDSKESYMKDVSEGIPDHKFHERKIRCTGKKHGKKYRKDDRLQVTASNCRSREGRTGYKRNGKVSISKYNCVDRREFSPNPFLFHKSIAVSSQDTIFSITQPSISLQHAHHPFIISTAPSSMIISWSHCILGRTTGI